MMTVYRCLRVFLQGLDDEDLFFDGLAGSSNSFQVRSSEPPYAGLSHRDALFACSMLLLALMLDGPSPMPVLEWTTAIVSSEAVEYCGKYCVSRSHRQVRLGIHTTCCQASNLPLPCWSVALDAAGASTHL